MSSTFNRAIVRAPAATFARGLTTANLGLPDHALALAQHAFYCAALERCGLDVVHLPPDPLHPDAPFVEDTAVLWGRGGILARPGAATRQGEVAAIALALEHDFPALVRIETPGTLDGGDVCETDTGVLIGISDRTNPEGARQLAAALAGDRIAWTEIDIRALPGLLHLKSGLSWLGEGRVAVIGALAGHPALARFDRVVVHDDEPYAANCVRVNDRVLIAAGVPRFEQALAAHGYAPLALDMSEFRKMDGGPTCLSLRYFHR